MDIDAVAKMSKAQLAELVRVAEELERREKLRKIDSYYPDEGPLRRELYPKHLEFFRAGAGFRERCIIAANRIGKCLTADSWVDTPGGKRNVGDLFLEGKPFKVMAWDGSKVIEAWASPPFYKGEEDCVRISCGDEWVETSLFHRVLTDRGWLGISDVLPEAFGRDVFFHRGSSSAPCPSVPTSGAGRLIERVRGCLGGYSQDSRQCDGRPQTGRGSDRVSSPSRDDAPRHTAPWLRTGGLVDRCTNTARRVAAHLSTLGGRSRDAARYFGSIYHTLCSAGSLCHATPRTFRQFSTAGVGQPQPVFLKRSYQDQSFSYASPFSLTNERSITYNAIGRKRVYDFEVPHYHNYVAGGLINHNSEGIGAYEMTLHLTGDYPQWWEGRKFDQPILAWAAGDTGKTVRDIIQLKLLGPPGAFGTGMIPGELIQGTTPKHGLPDAVESVKVKHISGGVSTIFLKSYDQRREAFQGTEIDVGWCDEEPPIEIWTEMLMRTMTTDGIMMLTFTPLMGISEVVRSFMPGLSHEGC